MPRYLFGLDLHKIRFRAFKNENMFNRIWYLRRERLIVYQLAMIITVCAESTATFAMSKYLDLQTNIEHQSDWSLYNNDIVGVASFTIWSGVFTAIVYGTMFFFLVFWPALHETRFWARFKLASAIFCTLCILGAAISSTVIVARHTAYYKPKAGFTPSPVDESQSTYPPLKYSDYGHDIAWVILLWIGFIPVVGSNILVHKASQYHLANPTDVEKFERKVEDEKASKSATTA